MNIEDVLHAKMIKSIIQEIKETRKLLDCRVFRQRALPKRTISPSIRLSNSQPGLLTLFSNGSDQHHRGADAHHHHGISCAASFFQVPYAPFPGVSFVSFHLVDRARGGFFVGVVATVALFVCCGKKRGQPQSSGKRIFTLGELRACTSDFSEAKQIGEGGSALVYKGNLPSGEDVAVKRLKKEDGGKTVPGFETEVENFSRAHHKHVVSLVGYCIAKTERILVYEYVPNKTLKFHLDGDRRGNLNWPKRLKIALGSAKGLAYLHEYCHPKIIHRDIKATNILLDHDFKAKIADFGLAKCIFESRSHVTTQPRGTFGYIDLEYCRSNQLTEKTDIYSFGMVLLELITGRKPSATIENHEGLFNWVRSKLPRYLEDGIFDSLVDRRLQNVYDREAMARMVRCAVACVYHLPQDRPKMSTIVRALEGHPDFLPSLTHLNFGEGPGPRADRGTNQRRPRNVQRDAIR